MLDIPEKPEEFRAVIAYYGFRIYELAALVGLHPSRLSAQLHGKVPMQPYVAERLRQAIVSSKAAQRPDST